MAGYALADHTGPERIVEEKYTVTLLFIPEEAASKMRFFFRDFKTGRSIETPISFNITISEADNALTIFKSPELSASSGVGDFAYKFPKGGLYRILMEFKVGDRPGNAYLLDPWSLWVPAYGGLENTARYPFGYSEISGFLVLLGALAVLVINIWYYK